MVTYTLTDPNGRAIPWTFPTQHTVLTSGIPASSGSIRDIFVEFIDALPVTIVNTFQGDSELSIIEATECVEASAIGMPQISQYMTEGGFVNPEYQLGYIQLTANNGHTWYYNDLIKEGYITDAEGNVIYGPSDWNPFQSYGQVGEIYTLAPDFSSDNIHYYRNECYAGYHKLPFFNPIGLELRASEEVTNDGILYPLFKYLLQGATPDVGEDPFKPDPQPQPTIPQYTPPEGDDIPEPELPPLSVTDTGFVTLYNPSTAQLRNLANYMWSPAFSLEAFKKMFADPMDCILSLKILPCEIGVSGARNVAIGNVSTGVTLTVASSQFVRVDCGSVRLRRNTYSYLDWSPYTKVSIYLPFLGERQLDTNEVMDKTLQVVYHIDILTGDGVAYVLVDNNVMYQYDCHCAVDIPVSGQNTTSTMLGRLSLISQGTMAVASGGTSMIGALSSGASTVAGMKPQIQHSGNLSASSGLLSCHYPFLIVSRPKICAPANQNKYTGYPLFETMRLANVHGYTKIYECHVENIPCTEEEKNMIKSILKEGIILP